LRPKLVTNISKAIKYSTLVSDGAHIYSLSY